MGNKFTKRSQPQYEYKHKDKFIAGKFIADTADTASSRAVAQSIKHEIKYKKPRKLKKEEIKDMRQEYLSVVDNTHLSVTQKKQNIHNTIISPIYRMLNLKASSIKPTMTFYVINKKENQISTRTIKSNLIYIGRFQECDIVLSDTNCSISRIQAYIFTIDDKLIVLDVWSMCGTKTIQRSKYNTSCINSVPNNRNILIFDKNEIVHLEFEGDIHLLIIPSNANQHFLSRFAIYRYQQQQQHQDKQQAFKVKLMNEEEKDNYRLNRIETVDEIQQYDNNNDYESNVWKNQQKNIDNKRKLLNKKQMEFKNWICNELALPEYYTLFVQNGFDEIEIVSMLSDDELLELGIDKKGSRMKILVYSQKLKQMQSDHEHIAELNEGKSTEYVNH